MDDRPFTDEQIEALLQQKWGNYYGVIKRLVDTIRDRSVRLRCATEESELMRIQLQQKPSAPRVLIRRRAVGSKCPHCNERAAAHIGEHWCCLDCGKVWHATSQHEAREANT